MKRIIIFFSALIFILEYPSFVVAETLVFSSGAGAMDGTAVVAEAKGFFKEQGIIGKVDTCSKGQLGFEKYLSGRTDFSICHVINIVLTEFNLSEHRLIATLAYTDTQTKVLAKKSSGIIKPSDLRGKKIATVRATTAHFYIDKFLVLNNIPRDEVDIIFMTKKQLPQAIVNGEVDAICQHGMPIENAKAALKEDWVMFRDGSIHRKPVFIIAPVTWLEAKPKQAKKILKAILEADKFIQTNTNESIRIIANAKGYSFEAMSEAVRDEINYELSLKQYLYMLLENMEQWAIDNNLVERKKPRNYLELIDYRPLEAVQPDKVTIIR